MTENITISKSAPPFTSMDFAVLRDIGIKHFESMGSKLWTDYNLHDPGITILEVLCYAITDLGYRTNFSIEDILASSETYPEDKQFFNALEILTCNPVTENDFRKILIDLDGIKNAWFVKSIHQEMTLVADVNSDGQWYSRFRTSGDTAKEIKLNGLYDVYIDLDDDVDHNDLDKVDDITKCAWQKLWKHRNLCEDYVAVNVIEEMEFGIEAQIELCPDADVNRVAGDIYYYIQEMLTPTIPFYSFQEMYETKKKLCEEIFEGPVLCNGFIDDDELDKAQLRTEVYLSDIWQVIMDVCGVAAIKKLLIHKCDGAKVIVDGSNTKKWCLKIDPFKKPKLLVECSQVFFQKEFDCIYPDDKKVLERITLQQKLHRAIKKSITSPLLDPGTDRNLEEYFTIQNEFPATYKIAEGQIIESDTKLRKAQAKQLRGYLTLFDEMLANYLAQLSSVKDLLSVSQPESHTYFYQSLYNVPGIKELIKAFPQDGSYDDWQNFMLDDNNVYIKKKQEIIESTTKQHQRKNIFLDHLLARFGEYFSDYVIKIYGDQCDCSDGTTQEQIADKLLKDKAAFLKNIPVLSSERGKGFNYKALDCGRPDVWDTINVAGVKKRVCAYLGFEDHKRKTLTCPPEFEIKPYRLITDGRVQTYRLRLADGAGNMLLDGLKDYRQLQNATKDARDLKEQVVREKVFVATPDANGFVRVYLKDKEDNIAMQSDTISPDEAKSLMDKIETLAFPDCCAVEGFHIVEHILLRPKDDDYTPLLDPVVVPDQLAIKVGLPPLDLLVEDAYSFWITVAVPNWLPQYKDNPNAQNQFEQLVRRETPAHIVVRFCWMSPKEMYQFETTFLKWLYENALEKPNDRELTEHVNNLVTILKKCSFQIRPLEDTCLSTAANTKQGELDYVKK
ncbi:MAG: hypothetical protein ABJB11_11905 [Ferruginibacter sp.]